MQIMWMIHRGKVSFLEEKDFIIKSVNYLKKEFSELKIVDKGVRFSIVYKKNKIDFGYGYYNMAKRDFSKYKYIVSTGLYAIFDKKDFPSDIIFPSISDYIYLSKKKTKVFITKNKEKFENKMKKTFTKMLKFEKNKILNLKDNKFVKNYNHTSPDKKIKPLKNIVKEKNAKMITCNTIFKPSELKKAKANINEDLEKFLTTKYDGLNCETLEMIQKNRNKLIMFSVAIDKPYDNFEISVNLSRQINKHDNKYGFDILSVQYFKLLLLRAVLEKL